MNKSLFFFSIFLLIMSLPACGSRTYERGDRQGSKDEELNLYADNTDDTGTTPSPTPTVTASSTPTPTPTSTPTPTACAGYVPDPNGYLTATCSKVGNSYQ